MTINRLKLYLTNEYNLTKAAMESNSSYIDKKNCVWYALQRGMGACQFATMDYSINQQEVYELFEQWKSVLLELEDLQDGC